LETYTAAANVKQDTFRFLVDSVRLIHPAKFSLQPTQGGFRSVSDKSAKATVPPYFGSLPAGK